MERLYPIAAGQLAERWTALMNELNRYGSGHYPDLLCVETVRPVRDAEHFARPDTFEMDAIFTPAPSSKRPTKK